MGKTAEDAVSLDPLAGSLLDYRDPHGPDILQRVEQFYTWQSLRRRYGYWPYSKSTEEAPGTVCAAKDDAGRAFWGVNFASEDYLSLASHPAIKEAAKAAVDDYGVHSAGPASSFGNTRYSFALQRTISEFLQMEHTVLYPTGWAAGYGVIKGLIRSDDHVVIDDRAHDCLKHGAYAATRNVHPHLHLNREAAQRDLKRIRAQDTQNGILVITEGLFSMDSDTPDIAAMQELCREYGATFMINVAHDLGNIGENGRGHLGLQQMIGKVDIVMGSFSKTFASNGGFVACNSPAVREYLRYFGSTGTSSNALSPIQSAIVLKAFEIVASDEGRTLRADLMRNILYLRDQLDAAGLEAIGDPSAIVCAKVGDEGLARLASQRLPRLGAIANIVEFPAVAKGSARFRLQVMAKHTKEHIDSLLVALQSSIETAHRSPRYLRTLIPTQRRNTPTPPAIPVHLRAVGEYIPIPS